MRGPHAPLRHIRKKLDQSASLRHKSPMSTDPKIKNILLLSVEDLNDWIEPLGGHPQAYTPNLTRLANRSTVFEHAYAAAPACSPSRTSTLFGQAPWRTGMYSNQQSWALRYPPGGRRSIIGQARDAGWETIGAGKVFHMGLSGFDTEDWSQFFHTEVDTFSKTSRAAKLGLLGPRTDFGPLPNSAPPQYDERNLEFMKTQLTRGSENQFWAFGTFSPHLPFMARQEFFDKIKTPVEQPPGFHGKAFDPDDLSEFNTLPPSARKLVQRQIGRTVYKTGEYQDFIHSYLACIAYADHIVGQLLDQLESQGLLENTLIIFWSDHGLQFGEKLAFHKFTLWERALRVPLMLYHPDLPARRVSEPVSLLDIYPTLQNLLGLTSPHPFDGQDLMPLIRGKTGRGNAISMWERFTEKPVIESHMAASVRTGQYRLIRYDTGQLELYDHEIDPFEENNLITDELVAKGSNIEEICSKLILHLPANPKPPLLKINVPKTYRPENRVSAVKY